MRAPPHDKWKDNAMTDLTDEAVKALLDGATPGPWRADGEPWNRVVWSSADNRVCFMAHSNGLNDERDIATSNLAAAAPDLARALLDARAERDRLAAELAAANAREAGLRNFVEDFAAAKIDALRFPRPLSPEDELDPVVEAEEVWAWQADARAALAQHGG